MPSPTAAPPSPKLPLKWHYDIKTDGLYRTDEYTGTVVKINNSHSPGGIIITEDWVYFADNSVLYRMDNENRKELLANEKSWPFHLKGNTLYYLNGSGLNRMNADGSGKELIFEGDYTGIEMTDTYIFYTMETSESYKRNRAPGHDDGPIYLGELHRVGLDAKNDVKVANLITNFTTYKNNVYYADGNDNAFYSLNPETLENAKLDKVKMVEDAYFSDDYLFFTTNSDRSFYKMSLKDCALTLLSRGWPRCWGILDGYVYFDTYTGITKDDFGSFRVSVNGTELEKVRNRF